MIVPFPSKFIISTDSGKSQEIQLGQPANSDNVKVGAEKLTAHSFVVEGKLVNIIDTPGLGSDSGSEEEEMETIERILERISALKEIHAFCILLNSNNAMLSPIFRFLGQLHKDAAPNILFCFTHIRGNLLMPGTTLPTLRQQLMELGVEIKLERDKIYCFDNEPLQFLACVKAGILFSDEDFEVFSSSWSRAVREQDRLLEHIGRLEPHRVRSTLSLIKTQNQAVPLACCFSEMSQAIQGKNREAKEVQVEAANLEREVQNLRMMIRERLDAKSKVEAEVDELNDLAKEFELEQEELLTAGVTFQAFLKGSSMIPSSGDVLGDFLDKTIQQEYKKPSGNRDTELIDKLRKTKMFYEEPKAVTEMALKEFGDRRGFTPEQLEEVEEELVKMKHFGQAINNSLSGNKGQSAARWEQMRLFYNGRGSKGEPIEVEGDFGPAVEVRRVRMAKGKEELELELEEELEIKMKVLQLLEAKMAKSKVELGGKKKIAAADGSREIKKLPESEGEQLTLEAEEQKGEAQKLSGDRERAERRERREREKLERSSRAEDYQGGGGHELEIRGKQVEVGQGLQIMSRRAEDQEPEIFTVL